MTADGAKVHGSQLGVGLQELLGATPLGVIRQVLFQQIDPLHWKVLVESGDGFDASLAAQLTELVCSNFGRQCAVEIERVSVVPRETSGKFRYYRPPGPQRERPGGACDCAGLQPQARGPSEDGVRRSRTARRIQMAQRRGTLVRAPLFYCCTFPFCEDPVMRALISLCAAALLFAAGCSKTNDATQDSAAPPPADQTRRRRRPIRRRIRAAQRQRDTAASGSDDASGSGAAPAAAVPDRAAVSPTDRAPTLRR